MPERPIIEFDFRGGIADDHELNFYEAGRFLYGAARMVYTLERFRQEGIVVQRITKRIDADLRVSSPRPGSFLQQIFVAAAPVLADVSIRAPLEALFTYFMGILLPPSRGPDVAVAIARHNVEMERQRTAQEGERTRQIEAVAEVANNNNATTQQALSILQNAQIGALRLPEDMRAMQIEIARLQSELEAQRAREAEIAPYREILDQIQKRDEDALLRKFQRDVSEVAYPLRSSANALHIRTGAERRNVAYLRQETVESISEETVDPEPTVAEGSIKMYDKETGYGKFRFRDSPGFLTFRVPGPLIREYRDAIVDAMAEEMVRISFYFVRDARGNPTRLVFCDVLEG